MWYALAIGRHLASRGHQVHILPRPLENELRRGRDSGLTVIDDIDVERKSPGEFYGNLRRLAGLIGSIGPDAVLAFGGEDHALWGLAKSIWARRMALVRTRVLDPKPPKRHPLSQWLNRSATDAIVVANTRHHADYLRRLRIKPDRLHIIPSGIDPASYRNLDTDDAETKRLALPPDKDIVVIVARFAPIKGYRVFVSAARKLKETHPNAHFLVIGYTTDYTADDLKRWLVESNLTDQFTICDQRLDNLPAVLSRCTVGVISSVGSETVSGSDELRPLRPGGQTR
jgi:glycosyltransferase involved in cell wall biosynthesis